MASLSDLKIHRGNQDEYYTSKEYLNEIKLTELLHNNGKFIENISEKFIYTIKPYIDITKNIYFKNFKLNIKNNDIKYVEIIIGNTVIDKIYYEIYDILLKEHNLVNDDNSKYEFIPTVLNNGLPSGMHLRSDKIEISVRLKKNFANETNFILNYDIYEYNEDLINKRFQLYTHSLDFDKLYNSKEEKLNQVLLGKKTNYRRHFKHPCDILICSFDDLQNERTENDELKCIINKCEYYIPLKYSQECNGKMYYVYKFFDDNDPYPYINFNIINTTEIICDDVYALHIHSGQVVNGMMGLRYSK